MATSLSAENFAPLNIAELTYMDADAAAGVTTLTVKSVQNFAVNDFIYFGGRGNESTEKRKISAVNTTTNVITLTAATTFLHKRFEEVIKVVGDQVKFYRATNVDGTLPASGSFSAIGSGIIDIDPDQLYTTFIDPSGSSSYWYTYTYYHSVALTETTLNNTQAKRGADYGHYVTVDSIRDNAGFNKNTNVTDVMIDEKRGEAESEVNGVLVTHYTLPLAAPVSGMVTNITRMLAVGLLLQKRYGDMTEGAFKKGTDLVAEARALLKMISDRKLILTDINNASLLTNQSVTGWPDDTTETALAADGGSTRKFYMSDKY